MKVLIPLASEFNALGHFDRLQALYIAGTELTLAIFLPVACAMAVLMKPLLTAWVGSAYTAYAPIAIILLVASLINTSQWPAGAVLQGMGRYQAMVMMSSVSAVSSVVLSIVLIGPLGLSGVAIATLIPTTVVCIGLVLPYAMRTMQVSAARLLREVMLPVIIPCVPGLLILLIAARQFRPVSLISIGALGAAGCATYAITYFLVGDRGSSENSLGTCSLEPGIPKLSGGRPPHCSSSESPGAVHPLPGPNRATSRHASERQLHEQRGECLQGSSTRLYLGTVTCDRSSDAVKCV